MVLSIARFLEVSCLVSLGCCGKSPATTTGVGGASRSTAASTASTSSLHTSVDSVSTAASETTSVSGSASTGQGGPTVCLDASVSASAFTIATNDLCVIAKYDAPQLSIFNAGLPTFPTWGRHHGLLTFKATDAMQGQGANITLERWSGSASTLVKTESTIYVPGASGTASYSRAVDLPTGQTALAYATTQYLGALEFLTDTAVAKEYLTPDLGDLCVLGDASAMRIVYQGADPIQGGGPQQYGVYTADFMGTTAGPSRRVSTDGAGWLQITADRLGNVFASHAPMTNELAGFAAPTIAPGAPASSGDLVATITGGFTLTAIPPSGAKPGLVVYQADDGNMPSPKRTNVEVVHYTATPSTVTGFPRVPLLVLTHPEASVGLAADENDELWVVIPNGVNVVGATVYVMARP